MSDASPLPSTSGSLLRLSGADALALLHRISTAHLAGLAPGEARATLFCDFRGRLLHRAVVAVTSDRAVWLLRDDAPGDALVALVERSVFREDVRIADAGAGRAVRARAEPTGLAPGTLREAEGVPRQVQVDPRSALEVVDGPPPAPGAARERDRIAAARPRAGHEIAGEFTPFEIGLAHEVHLSKGCYTGQEALMRLVTYGAVRRRLAVVSGDGAPPPVPCDLASAGVRCGRLTSASADDRGWTGLAVVAIEAAAAGRALVAEGGAEVRVGRVVPETRPLGLPTT